MKEQLPNYEKDFSGWYNELIRLAELADTSPVRGCMILRPYGYAIWENIKNILDDKIKETGHENAYFPLLIPKSYLSKEASHIEGFAKECAIVTHSRLKEENGGVIIDPSSKLDEELIIRPTSETIIWDSFKKWISSYRDLPIMINQWANVVRWEMRTRMFLRTTEILWQEGHTAHQYKEEALEESKKMLNVYASLLEDYLAIPVIKGKKTEYEKFAGADITYTIEILTKEKKALQACTSHFLGTNFAQAFDVKYANKEGKLEYVWGTSWGATTRFIGALIMTHSDNKGLVLPPKIAPYQVVIIPIIKSGENVNNVLSVIEKLEINLRENNIRVKKDLRDYLRPGWKYTEYEMKGIPIRLTIGSKDIEKNTIELYRRDTSEKLQISLNDVEKKIKNILSDFHENLLQNATNFQENNTTIVESYDEFKNTIKKERGFILAHWDGTTSTEKRIKEETKATIRCIPNKFTKEPGKCILTGKPSKQRVLFAEAY